MRFNPSPTELTTAATDAALGLLCLVIVYRLSEARPGWVRSIWLAVVLLMAAASFLGAIAHGVDLAARTRSLLWHPLYLSLGLTIALFVVAALHDWRGLEAARRALPWAAAIGVGFYLLTQALGGSFLVFIAYEGVAMLAALAIYLLLWSQGLTGAGLIASGIGISLVAGVVQATSWRLTLVVPFDHNGLFHLVQLVGMVVLAAGVRERLNAL